MNEYALKKIEANLAKLADTDEDTVCVFEVRMILRQLQAQLEMLRLGLTEETPDDVPNAEA